MQLEVAGRLDPLEAVKSRSCDRLAQLAAARETRVLVKGCEGAEDQGLEYRRVGLDVDALE